jgi:hypothetical protein
MKAKSLKASSPSELKTVLHQAISNGFTPTLAVVFISIKQDRKAVCEILKNESIDIFGATSCGEFIEGYQGESSIVVLLLDTRRDAYKILFQDLTHQSLETASRQIADAALHQYNKPSLLVTSTGTNAKGDVFDGEGLAKTLNKFLPEDILFFGGMAGDDMTFTGSAIFINEAETDYGIAAIAFDSDIIDMKGMAITGWKQMGISRTITKCAGNKVYTIDNASAVEMYFKYLGKEDKTTDHDFNLFEELGFTFPFITEREPGGDMVLRTPIKVDHIENALVMDVEMTDGTKFWFSMPPDFDIVDEILKEANEVKKSSESEADALLIFSCAGRPPVLGPLVTAENDGLAEVWKTPMAGFFTYGEFGRSKNGKQEFHSGACCWVALKEK